MGGLDETTFVGSHAYFSIPTPPPKEIPLRIVEQVGYGRYVGTSQCCTSMYGSVDSIYFSAMIQWDNPTSPPQQRSVSPLILSALPFMETSADGTATTDGNTNTWKGVPYRNCSTLPDDDKPIRSCVSSLKNTQTRTEGFNLFITGEWEHIQVRICRNPKKSVVDCSYCT